MFGKQDIVPAKIWKTCQTKISKTENEKMIHKIKAQKYLFFA